MKLVTLLNKIDCYWLEFDLSVRKKKTKKQRCPLASCFQGDFFFSPEIYCLLDGTFLILEG